MYLKNNPFFILNVTPDDNRRTIISKAEDLSLLGDPKSCEEAQNILINPVKRLLAELTWFIDCDEIRITGITNAIDNNSFISTDGLESLSRLNAVIHNLEIESSLDYLTIGFYVVEIDNLFSGIEPSLIKETINKSRDLSGFSVISETDILEGLKNIRDYIRILFSEKLSCVSEDHNIEFATILSERYLSNDNYNSGIIIEDIIDQYEIRMHTVIESTSTEIYKKIDIIKESSDSSRKEMIEELSSVLNTWIRIVLPIQIKSEISCISNDDIKDVVYSIRNLCLFLNNEKKSPEEALNILSPLMKWISDSKELYDFFCDDAETLIKMVSNNKDYDEIMPVIKELETMAQKKAPGSFNKSQLLKTYTKAVKLLSSSSLDRSDFSDLIEIVIILTFKASSLLDYSAARDVQKVLAEGIDDLKYSVGISENLLALSSKISTFPNPYRVPTFSSSSNGFPDIKLPKWVTAGIILAVLGFAIYFFVSLTNSTPSRSYNSTSTFSSSTTKSYNYENKSYSTTTSSYNSGYGYYQSSRKNALKSQIDDLYDEIEDYENELDTLSDDLDYYKEMYYSTGYEFYRTDYNTKLQQYNRTYEEYEQTLDEYNELVDEYNSLN